MDKTSQDRTEREEHLISDEALAKVRQLLPSFRTGMLVTQSMDEPGIHMRPVGLLGDLSVFGGALWFFVDDRSRKVREIQKEPNAWLVFQNDEESRYLQLDGTAVVVADRTKMRELYTPLVRTWFPDGLDDPHLTLIRFDATSGSFWDSPGGGLRVLAAFAKSVVTGTPGKAGRAGTIDLEEHRT